MKRYLSGILVLFVIGGCRTMGHKEGEASLAADHSQDYKNYSGSVVCKPGSVVEAKTVIEIQEAVRKAAEDHKNIRVISLDAPRSYSPVICPEEGGIMLNIKSLNRLISVDGATQTAIVEPGLLVTELQNLLDPMGYTFPVTPDYNGVSVAGGMATGAHHSSLKIPTEIADWVEEIKLVDGRGNLRTINGKELDLARVHLGLLGVIYQLKVRIVPQFKVQYNFSKLSDDQLENTIDTLVRPHDYARVLWFPAHKTFILDHFDKVPNSTPGDSVNNLWTSTPPLPAIDTFAVKTLNSSQVTQCAAEAVRIKTYEGPFKAVKSDDDAPVGWSHKMIAGTCPDGRCSWDNGLKTRTVEVGIAMSQVSDWIKDVKALIAARKACFPVLGIYMRFSASSDSALGEAAGRDSVVFEIHIPQNPTPMLEPSSDVYDEMVQMTLRKYNGRPHWGKNSMPYFLDLGTKQYPMWEQFEDMRNKMDPNDLFISPFWKNIRSHTQPTHSTGCAVTRQCICEQDSDCGSGAKCEPGVFFKEAKVCRK